MAWPATSYTAAYDKLANTFDRSLDSKLWPALIAKAPFLGMISMFDVNTDYFEWETANVMSRVYTEASSGSTTIDSSGSNTTLVVTDATGLEEGALIRNATRATPIGTYGADETMEVTGISTNTLTVVRDAGRQNSGTGSTVHALADTFEVIMTPKEEGSSMGDNKYQDVSLTGNYTNIVDFSVMVTGTQAESKRIVADDSLQTQIDNQILDMSIQLEKMVFYGCLNNSANAGSDSYVRRTKGLQNYVLASGGNVDYTTLDVTEDALNTLVQTLITNNSDPGDPYVIVAHPFNFGKIVDFGADKVRIGQVETRWGRTLKTWMSKWGIEFPLVMTNNCSKSDVFIVDLKKIGIANFRPWKQGVLHFEDDLVDADRYRHLGEFGVKVVDGIKSHAALCQLPWS